MIFVNIYNPPSDVKPEHVQKALMDCLSFRDGEIVVISHTEGIHVSVGGWLCHITMRDDRHAAEIKRLFRAKLAKVISRPMLTMTTVFCFGPDMVTEAALR